MYLEVCLVYEKIKQKRNHPICKFNIMNETYEEYQLSEVTELTKMKEDKLNTVMNAYM